MASIFSRDNSAVKPPILQAVAKSEAVFPDMDLS